MHARDQVPVLDIQHRDTRHIELIEAMWKPMMKCKHKGMTHPRNTCRRALSRDGTCRRGNCSRLPSKKDALI